MFYTRLIARLEAQIEALREAGDYSYDLYLAFGQTYLLADRPREAGILFERLAPVSVLHSRCLVLSALS